MNNMMYEKDQMDAQERYLFCKTFIEVSDVFSKNP